MANAGLHLPDLHVEGFRGIDKLSIPRLGRVTLIADRNSVGKTTVLDAVRVYASRGHFRTLSSLLEGRKTRRAEVHAWLATREKPRQMGQAITARDLDVDSKLCQRFVAWLRRLFGEEPA